jgi:ribonuclease HI
MQEVEIYTDGSFYYETKVGGWAAVLMGSSGQYKEIAGAEKGTTSQRMELTAAIEALQALKSACHVTLTSDSSYLIKSFNEGWLDNWYAEDFKIVNGYRNNTDLWKVLYSLNTQHDIRWVHIRGHQGHKWNTRCDWLAGMERKKLEEKLGIFPKRPRKK